MRPAGYLADGKILESMTARGVDAARGTDRMLAHQNPPRDEPPSADGISAGSSGSNPDLEAPLPHVQNGHGPVPAERETPPATREVMEQVRLALTGLKYGHVTIVVQDGHVMQIDRVQQQRFFRSGKKR